MRPEVPHFKYAAPSASQHPVPSPDVSAASEVINVLPEFDRKACAVEIKNHLNFPSARKHDDLPTLPSISNLLGNYFKRVAKDEGFPQGSARKENSLSPPRLFLVKSSPAQTCPPQMSLALRESRLPRAAAQPSVNSQSNLTQQVFDWKEESRHGDMLFQSLATQRFQRESFAQDSAEAQGHASLVAG